MRTPRTALFIAMSLITAGTAQAGQTGSFDALAHRSWACRSEAAMAEVMAQKTPSAMKARAVRENCVMLDPGTRLWTHGGNALIAFGGMQGSEETLYYPVAALAQ